MAIAVVFRISYIVCGREERIGRKFYRQEVQIKKKIIINLRLHLDNSGIKGWDLLANLSLFLNLCGYVTKDENPF